MTVKELKDLLNKHNDDELVVVTITDEYDEFTLSELSTPVLSIVKGLELIAELPTGFAVLAL